MPRPIRTRQSNLTDHTIQLRGGLNDSVSANQLKPGELTFCLNYMEKDGGKPGYTSVAGYEVFDGQATASSVALGAEDDDTARETQRALIAAPTGSGAIRGVHLYEGELYCKRDDASAVNGLIYKETGAGWGSSLTLPSTPTAVWAGGTCRWINASFEAYPTTTPPTANAPCWFMVDGVSQPISYDGTTVRRIDHANLPSNASFSPAQVFPTHLAEYDSRLWLAFPGGHLYASDIGDPGTWTAGIYYAIGGEITNMVKGVGSSLIIFTEDKIKIIRVPDTYDSSFLYKLDDFFEGGGAVADTAVAMMGDVYYVGERGPTSLAATEKYGDFAAGHIGKRLFDTFDDNRANLVAALPHREYNQYRLYFSNGLILCFTFRGEYVSSATRWLYDDAPACLCEGEGSGSGIETYFGGADGYVYKSDSGTSFDGAAIDTRLVTAYANYGYVRRNKRFTQMGLELTADVDTTLYIKPEFNYRDGTSPKGLERTPEVLESGGIWGAGVWGTFVWGGQYVNAPNIDIPGYAVNMAIVVRSSSKYRSQHTIHNLTVDYEVTNKIM